MCHTLLFLGCCPWLLLHGAHRGWVGFWFAVAVWGFEVLAGERRTRKNHIDQVKYWGFFQQTPWRAVSMDWLFIWAQCSLPTTLAAGSLLSDRENRQKRLMSIKFTFSLSLLRSLAPKRVGRRTEFDSLPFPDQSTSCWFLWLPPACVPFCLFPVALCQAPCPLHGCLNVWEMPKSSPLGSGYF